MQHFRKMPIAVPKKIHTASPTVCSGSRRRLREVAPIPMYVTGPNNLLFKTSEGAFRIKLHKASVTLDKVGHGFRTD